MARSRRLLLPKTLSVPSFAKINLGIEVLGPREDGYHDLRTIFQTIGLHDDLEISSRRSGSTSSVECDDPDVPTDETNLALRAALDLGRFAGLRRGVHIRITKRIPVGGGLGGGSSNAAAVLLALDRLWGLDLGPAGLHLLARRLGADVPFFLMGGTAVGLGRGDEVYPLYRQLRASVVVVSAGLPISTAAVFRRLDRSLTPHANGYTIFRFVSRDLEGLDAYAALSNDLEKPALEESPPLRAAAGRIRDLLTGSGARLSLLSGTGSCYFGLFDRPAAARRAEVALTASHFRATLCRTLSLGQYRRSWSKALGSVGAVARGR